MEIRTILLVDDDPTIRMLGELGFAAIGHWRTLTAHDGFAALTIANRADVDVDVIVLDMAMPGMNGIETLRQLRTAPNTADVPVIMLTASVHRADLVRYLDAGADGVLTKPFTPAELPERLARIVNGEVCVA